jgi:hypothetical protein
MRQAVRRPRHGVEPFRVNRTSINRALAERAVVNPLQGIFNLLKDCRVELSFDEIFTRRFICDALVGRITADVTHLFATKRELAPQPGADPMFESHKPLSIVLCVNHSLLR